MFQELQPESDMLSSVEADIPERWHGISMEGAARRLMILPEHAANLFKLGQYLRQLPPDYPRFSMATYFHYARGLAQDDQPEMDRELLRWPREYGAAAPDCGTTACALGHGPVATDILREYNESWPVYGNRLTGMSFNGFGFEYGGSKDFSALWCFGGGWEAVDSLPRSAGARILALLDDFLLSDPLLKAQVLDANLTHWDTLNLDLFSIAENVEEEEELWDKVTMLYAPYQTRQIRQLP